MNKVDFHKFLYVNMDLCKYIKNILDDFSRMIQRYYCLVSGTIVEAIKRLLWLDDDKR